LKKGFRKGRRGPHLGGKEKGTILKQTGRNRWRGFGRAGSEGGKRKAPFPRKTPYSERPSLTGDPRGCSRKGLGVVPGKKKSPSTESLTAGENILREGQYE